MPGQVPAKKKAKSADPRTSSGSDAFGSSPFAKLPLEIIAEILFYTRCPREVLALARTTKFLCDTLLNSDASYIWKRARRDCLPAAIPDPSSNFTEPSYAAFIFDQGNCEVKSLVSGPEIFAWSQQHYRFVAWL